MTGDVDGVRIGQEWRRSSGFREATMELRERPFRQVIMEPSGDSSRSEQRFSNLQREVCDTPFVPQDIDAREAVRDAADAFREAVREKAEVEKELEELKELKDETPPDYFKNRRIWGSGMTEHVGWVSASQSDVARWVGLKQAVITEKAKGPEGKDVWVKFKCTGLRLPYHRFKFPKI